MAEKIANPHNPEFITKRPWYLGESGSSLQHHVSKRSKDHVVSIEEADRLAKDNAEVLALKKGMWIEAMYRGKKPYLPAQIKKVRSDAKLDLSFERGKEQEAVPRSQIKLPKRAAGARQGLEALGKIDWDAKRDRWHGYAASMHTEVHDRYDELEKARNEHALPKEANISDSSDDEYALNDELQQDFQKRVARQGGVGGAQMKTTVRNLRIREDTAKYLRNLDPDSAYYDPKSRAMRENPTPHLDPNESVYAGDNFARATGDAIKLAETQLFAWDKTHIVPQAEPSRAEIVNTSHALAAEAEAAANRAKLLAKYGDSSTIDLDQNEKNLRSFHAQAYHYQEYDKHGKLLSGTQPQMPPSSKYNENILINNHTSVWGSFFCPVTFQWGYADDHSTVRNSYATGQNGKAANDTARLGMLQASRSEDQNIATKRLLDDTQENEAAAAAEDINASHKKFKPTSHLYGTPDYHELDLDESKVNDAMRRIQSSEREKTSAEIDSEKAKYNSLASTTVTPEEMEAYRRTKLAADDPMRAFL